MNTPNKIKSAAQRLKDGHRVNRITVRDFLGHFGAERRGAVKVQAIRSILDSLDLRTEPDFETAWIDGPLLLRLKEDAALTTVSTAGEEIPENSVAESEVDDVLDSTPSKLEQIQEQVESSPTSLEPESPTERHTAEASSSDDPTFRIGRLPAANKKLIVVNQNDSVSTAVTLLLQHDFSQLPVMQGEREVKGVVTWKSIASKLALGARCQTVADCREDARIVDSNRTLFDSIPTIVDYGYVLVRDQRDKRITGVVTASDLSLEFRVQSEPFLLLREVELHVRQLLIDKVDDQDFELLSSSSVVKSSPRNIAGLTFGEYVRLVQHPCVWNKLGLNVDQKILTELLESVRIIRNDVMHFDPDPMTEDELRTLKQAVRFMQELYELLP